MNGTVCALLAALSIWEYPARQPKHEALKAAFAASAVKNDSAGMEKSSREAVEIFPDDPTWRYNHACSLARIGIGDKALDELEKAVRLGFRDTVGIRNDRDFSGISKMPRFEAILELSENLSGLPPPPGPVRAIAAKGEAGGTIVLGDHNLAWNFELGVFSARMELENANHRGNSGDLYFNRDSGHSMLKLSDFPGITKVVLDGDGRGKSMDLDFPNISFPYPVFGNCSRALVEGPFWRSLPRTAMTGDTRKLKAAYSFYRSNQVWVFPAVYDCPPAGTNGDVFASVTPYWIQTQGKSWSDQYYLRAALEISRSLSPDVKNAIVAKGLLAPVVQTVLRKTARGVLNEDDYLSPKAHPTAFPPNGIDMDRLKAFSRDLTVDAIPPVVVLKGVAAAKADGVQPAHEVTYATPCAAAFVLRSPEMNRVFTVGASGANEYAFVQVHGKPGAVRIERLAPDAARMIVDKRLVGPVDRVDVAVFGKTAKSGWGPPAFVSFAVVDPSAPYADPVLLGVPPSAPARK